MGDQQNGHPPLPVQAPEEPGNLGLIAQVQVRRGFVENQEARFLGKSPGQNRALTLAAAQTLERDGGQVQHPGRRHGLTGDREILRAFEEAARSMRVAPHQDELLDAVRERRRLLGHHGHLPRQLPASQSLEQLALQKDLPGGGLQHFGEDADQRRLARAVGPDDTEDFPGGDRKRQAREPEGRRPAPFGAGVRDVHASELDQRRHGIPRYWVRRR